MDEFTNDDQILALLMADSEVFVLIFNYINIKTLPEWVRGYRVFKSSYISG